MVEGCLGLLVFDDTLICISRSHRLLGLELISRSIVRSQLRCQNRGFADRSKTLAWVVANLRALLSSGSTWPPRHVGESEDDHRHDAGFPQAEPLHAGALDKGMHPNGPLSGTELREVHVKQIPCGWRLLAVLV
eukprot:s7038_g4.t1